MHEVIADMPLDERPRERMRMHGAETLSDSELVALLLGSGKPGKNAIQLARELLSDGFSSLARRDVDQIAKLSGIGQAKATRVVAAFEVARRVNSHAPEDPPDFDADILGRTLIPKCAHLSQERLGAVFLDSRSRIIREREIYVGTISRALVSTRDIVRYALDENAVGVVLYHNHPSGDPSASNEDITYTRRAQESLNLIDLELIDHLIVGAHRFLSMKRKGLF